MGKSNSLDFYYFIKLRSLGLETSKISVEAKYLFDRKSDVFGISEYLLYVTLDFEYIRN